MAEALEHLKRDVRSKPQDVAARIFLFQLFAVLGQWDRAQAQLVVCGQLDPATEMMVKAYTEAIRCERLRGEVMAGRKTPLVLGEPEPWLAAMIQALMIQDADQAQAAEALRSSAFEDAPETPGTIRWRSSGVGADEVIESASFQWIADAEMTLGPILECLIGGRYYWVPLAHIQSIRIEPPTDLRDLVWLPAQFTWAGGGQQLGFIPTRYWGSESSDDDAVRLARKTQWVAGRGGVEIASGQRLMATDQSEYPLMNIRGIDFELAAVQGDGPSVTSRLPSEGAPEHG